MAESSVNWTERAWQLDAAEIGVPRVPLHVLTGEAVDVARFFQRRWSAERDPSGKVVVPGLELCRGYGGITPELGQEILELQQELQAAQSAYILTVAPKAEAAPTERAHFVLSEISAVLEWFLDDGVEDVKDAQLDRLNETYRDAASQDALAAALDDYVALASRYRAELDGLGDFDAALLDEAKVLAAQLRERSAQRIGPQNISAEQRALDLRSRLASMLAQRMSAVRSAAQFIFRREPSIVREATSAYQRRRRAEQRRKSEASSATEAETAVAAAKE
ncbi:MAG: hypothetical protein JW940_30040 [Polyangiaceae bacterium]|nr:hypothetical protein [Polyangiaceae bacterium]